MLKEFESNIKFVMKNVSAVFILKVFGTGLLFIFQVILGNRLGANYYGQFTIYTTLLNLFLLVTVFGIDSTLIRYIPRVKEDDRLRVKLLKKSLFNVLTVSIIVVLFMYIFRWPIMAFFNIKNEKIYYILPIILLMMSVSKVLDGFFQGEKKTSLATFFSPLLLTGVKLIVFFIAAFLLNKNLVAAVISVLVSEGILVLIRIIYVKKEQGNIVKTSESVFTKQENIKFMKYSLSLFAILSLGTMVSSVDKIIINAYMGSAEVGVYKVAENYMALVGIFASPFVVFWPVMSELYKKKQLDVLDKIFNYAVKLISLLAVPVMVFIIVFSNDLLGFFGKEFSQGTIILCILLIGTGCDSLTGPVGALLNMTDYAKYNLVDTIILAVVDISLNLLLVPRMGAVGAAIATAVSLVSINLINIVQNKILLKVFPYDRNNLLILLMGAAAYLVDKVLYPMININILVKMVVFILINYVIVMGAYILIAKPDFKGFMKSIKSN
jgi:O-antigen/teichoic acid export membrane protein